MFNKEKFNAALSKNKISAAELSKALNINACTIYRKVRGTCDFSLGEVTKISEILKLSGRDLKEIFFSQKIDTVGKESKVERRKL